MLSEKTTYELASIDGFSIIPYRSIEQGLKIDTDALVPSNTTGLGLWCGGLGVNN